MFITDMTEDRLMLSHFFPPFLLASLLPQLERDIELAAPPHTASFHLNSHGHSCIDSGTYTTLSSQDLSQDLSTSDFFQFLCLFWNLSYKWIRTAGFTQGSGYQAVSSHTHIWINFLSILQLSHWHLFEHSKSLAFPFMAGSHWYEGQARPEEHALGKITGSFECNLDF